MSNKRISELGQASILNSPDLFAIEQDGVAKNVSWATIKDHINSVTTKKVDDKTTDIYASINGVINDLDETERELNDAINDAKDELNDNIDHEVGDAKEELNNTINDTKGELEDSINTKVSKPVGNPDGQNGQVLVTNGDGSTSWTNRYLPSDEQVTQAVDEWFDEHPEERTQIVDNSIGLVKFTDEAKNTIFKSNRNLLDNWYFAGGGSQLGDGILPINQRGPTSLSSTGYFIDRWRRTTSGSTITINLDSEGLYCSTEASGFVRQCLSCEPDLIGKTLTYSLLYKVAGLKTITHVFETNGRFGTNNATDNDPAYYSTGRFFTDNEVVGFYAPIDDKLIAVKLEVGSVQTLAHQEGNAWILNDIPDYNVESYKCRMSTADPTDTYSGRVGIDHSNNFYNQTVLMMGDSWCRGYVSASTTLSDGWTVKCAEILKCNRIKVQMSGGGFSRVGSVSSMYPGYYYDHVLDVMHEQGVDLYAIIVQGGVNDLAENSPPDLLAGMQSFMAKANTYFPKAKVYLIPTWADRQKTNDWAKVSDKYVSYAKDLGMLVSTKSFNWFQEYHNPDMIAEDHIHLTRSGYELLGKLIANFILSGNDDIIFKEYAFDRVNENLLDNALFTYPRTISGLTSVMPITDGDCPSIIENWYTRGDNVTTSLTEDGIVLSYTELYHSICQAVPERIKEQILGKTVTFSALIKNFSGSNGRLIIGDATSPYAVGAGKATRYFNSDGLHSLTFELPTELTNEYLTFSIANYTGTAAGFTVVAAKLELGTEQTLAYLNNGEWVLKEQPKLVNENRSWTYKADGEIGLFKHNKYKVEPSIFYNLPEGGTYYQGCDIFDNKLYAFTGENVLGVYELGNVDPIKTYVLSDGVEHVNSCCFSDEYYNGNTIPLLYANVAIYAKRFVAVLNITENSATVIRKYMLGDSGTGYCPNSSVNRYMNHLIDISYNGNNYRQETSNMTMRIYDLSNPVLMSGINYSLQVIDSFDLPWIYANQDVKFIDGYFYVVSSAPNDWRIEDNQHTSWIYCIDPYKKTIVGIMKEFPSQLAQIELEGICKYKDGLFLLGAGRRSAYIYDGELY